MENLGFNIMYVVIAIVIVVCSVLTVTTKKILRSATYLLFVLLATAMIYFQLGYEFLGATQIAVYAGGIVLLFVFAILLTQKPGNDAEPLSSHKRVLGLTASILGAGACIYALIAHGSFVAKTFTSEGKFDMNDLGHALLGSGKLQYLLPFEAISVLLLACIIAGIVIARKR